MNLLISYLYHQEFGDHVARGDSIHQCQPRHIFDYNGGQLTFHLCQVQWQSHVRD